MKKSKFDSEDIQYIKDNGVDKYLDMLTSDAEKVADSEEKD